MQDCDGGTTCHGETMERVTESTLGIQPPDIRQVLLDAFWLPKPGWISVSALSMTDRHHPPS
ncbi:hypothetical protein [Haloarcula pellucida]|uniref:Uncharacterized protein n=1 Tax=Haloarcula pellucida TaxID=1427151 RepID=A0A830GMH9_9EURY|nr:hypothetical protein [Halomicroarcula pellucida]GGN94862.1 hypothetical protein GCM10009030_21620 [Halomicroarcula pellucida]